ncbi:MAG: phospho-N-acetylmuramoyl-pentapeptide-transferase [Lachnospiraceae bacterium]
MLYNFFYQDYIKEYTFVSIIFAFILTCVAITLGKEALPKDGGRAFAVNGKLSAGKPRGAGIIFTLTFILSAVLFVPLTGELTIYLILTLAAMLSGFFDDSAQTPWGELKKGLIDFVIAVMVAVTYLNFNSNTIMLPFTDYEVTLHPLLFGFLIVVLVWASINVTNCTDGVDGLCGTVSCITLATIFGLYAHFDSEPFMRHIILLLIVSILGYLWFNASPSKLLMGDAGSRAIGLFIAIAVLKTHSPLYYIPAAIILIIDGGLGLIKVSLLRFFKIKILKNVRTPIHDHVRKNKGWSDTQVVLRFAIIQTIISASILYALH